LLAPLELYDIIALHKYVFLVIVLLHVLYALTTPISDLSLPSVVSGKLPLQFRTYSVLSFPRIRHHTPFVKFLQPILFRAGL